MEIDLDDLYRAAKSGNWDVIQQHEHQLGNQLTPNRDTVLHVLFRFGDSSSALQQILGRNPKLLLKQNADNDTPLHIAARKGHLDIVRAIIDCIIQHREYSIYILRSINLDGDTALHEAIKNNHREIIELLVDVDPTLVDIKNYFGRSPLYLAAENGDEGVVSLILSAEKGDETVVGPSTPTTTFKDQRNELHAAAIGNFPECLKLILRELPHLAQETDVHGWMAIHYAARLNHLEVVREMLLSGNLKGEDKALHIAVEWGHVQIIEELLTHCPRCWSAITSTRKNIIHIAVENEQEEVLNFILKKSWASELVNGRDKYGNTPVHSYVATKRMRGRELLKYSAVEINALNKDGCTPLDSLRWSTHQDEKRKDFLKTELEKSGATERRFIVQIKDESETQSKDVSEKERMDKMVQTYQVVATLIVAISFAAAFTVPGGYESNDILRKGQPVLLNKAGFIAFIIFDYAALFLSWTALIGLLLHPLFNDHERRNRNLRLCGLTIILSLVALLPSVISGLYITLPKKGMRIWLFIFPSLFAPPYVAMISNFQEDIGIRDLFLIFYVLDELRVLMAKKHMQDAKKHLFTLLGR